ncbi:DNA/RNA non-specific endonuclease [Aquimarina sp. AD10]|uniref:DNA/RNA non-specific endonuclease n=1 Tax=Aquimarina sp. AD10 TaxID=1714849 RepID=UPI000E47597A|nr:DNA/RNA non-specific endonuclease [Aquimarina sp. AD10]AXT59440.1 DNA/RNA non-specific endonuclease [Aquimarina sp. AD10]RKN00342.1 DNA/RNA non-specific endonuclease [Aquimarina sp. AD10]
MRLLNVNFIILFIATTLLITSCNTNDDDVYEPIVSMPLTINGELDAATNFYDNQGPHEHNFSGKRSSGFTEGYESGSKPRYATGNVTLSSSGNWTFSDALIGTLSRDRKFGRKSVRMRNTGYVVMSFNMDNGARTVRVRHAKYGNDGNSSWRLIASYDNGASWSFVGTTVNTASTTLNTVSFEVNETRSVRYGISKTSGGSNRINIDNLEIVTEGTGGGDGDGGNNGGSGRNSNIAFGNPSNANSSANNYFLSKPEFTLSYNNNNGTPNWVSWHLNSDWLGNRGRCNCFQQDRSLPSSFNRITENEYRGSGFHRGHICPSADRTVTAQENENTFFMTNMAPQAPRNNTRPWVGLERYLRTLVNNGNEIHIISGVSGTGGTGSNGFRTTLSNGRINVPDSFWKVALVLRNGSNDINRVTTSTRIIAINVPNDQNVSSDWRQYTTTVDAIESLTGYDLFENIPNDIEAVLESRLANRSFN